MWRGRRRPLTSATPTPRPGRPRGAARPPAQAKGRTPTPTGPAGNRRPPNAAGKRPPRGGRWREKNRPANRQVVALVDVGEGQVADVAVADAVRVEQRARAGRVGDQVGVRQHGACVRGLACLFVSFCMLVVVFGGGCGGCACFLGCARVAGCEGRKACGSEPAVRAAAAPVPPSRPPRFTRKRSLAKQTAEQTAEQAAEQTGWKGRPPLGVPVVPLV
jgi:hypothetical protein